ncbi:MAG: phosphoribosylformylglycinamidine synthase subunit PurL [Calditrichaeota bacterium]|nr:phosphoribosylformylglycinamidine synthase subunit PurL [Calditrichota bacterium]
MSPDPNPLLTAALAQGLTAEEFASICETLGREPNLTEVAIYAVMWSEHCSYKNSILELKTLPRSGGRLLAQAGEENAGLVDIGDGWAVAFKIESHNHPSAVEPFQGAATGVGGILRDIFTMGARPIAVLDSLRFGIPEGRDKSRQAYLFDGVVRGIGHYGNCFGVPTVAGEVAFDSSYSGNPLVNAMAVGIVRTDCICRAKAAGPGNPVYYIGSRTGRDGIHGATFASDELSADNEAKRPSVQVGDPFAEKLLLEATLELAATDALVAIQDMGAAGLSCSSSEMSAAGGVGMSLDLDRVPLRENDMEAWEIMLSESQERMLLVAKAGREEEIVRTVGKWDLSAVKVGTVTDDERLRIMRHGIEVANIPAKSLALGGGAPQYRRDSRPPATLDALTEFDPLMLPDPADPGATLLNLLAHPDIASKWWVFEQYDQSVRTNTVLEPGRGDAAVVRVEGTTKGLALKTDGNGRKVRIDPRVGTALAVVEAARNVACTGALPLAVTNCLNFGHPYKPEVYHFFREAVAGMGEACRALETPVTGGNVSFYNETEGEAVLPTPVIGMLGLLDDVRDFVPGYFQSEGDLIYLLGTASGHGLGGSSYLNAVHHLMAGALPVPDFVAERCLHNLLVSAAKAKLIRSAHDVSDGGLAVALAECCIMNAECRVQNAEWTFDSKTVYGATIDYPVERSTAAHLFGEPPGLVVVSVRAESAAQFESLTRENSVAARQIGRTGGSSLNWRDVFELPLNLLIDAYYRSIPLLMENQKG